MKIKDFIQQWVQIQITDPTIIIPEQEETTTPIHLITTGNTTIKNCYSWSCNDRCLYFKDQLVCFKSHGLIFNDSRFSEQLQPIWSEIGIRSYLFTDTPSDAERLVGIVLKKFYDCAKNDSWIDEIIITFFQTFNCKFEDKYLNYCSKLTLDKFQEISEKHAKRRKTTTDSIKVLNGLWYEDRNPELINISYDSPVASPAGA